MSDVNKVYIDRAALASAPVQELIVAVGPNGAGGSKFGHATLWTMSFSCCAWRICGETMRADALYVFRPTLYEELSGWTNGVNPYEILRLRARLGAVEFGDGSRMEAYLEEIVGTADDNELRARIEELNAPIIHDDPLLGELVFDRQFDWFEGDVEWNGEPVTVNLSVATPDQLDEVLQSAHLLWKQQAEWTRRVSEFTVERLLPLKNDNWLDEGERPLTADEFLMRITLRSITVESEGQFTFWHDDGDLFFGHSIQICGDLEHGPTSADIPG